MQTSTLLKIGIAGMFITVIAAFVPILVALLFHNDKLSLWTHDFINETDATVLLILFASMIIYAMVKRGQQRYYEEMHKRSGH